MAALLLVPESRRAGIVDEVERRLVQLADDPPARAAGRKGGAPEFWVASTPEARDGYVEQRFTAYEARRRPRRRSGSRRAG